eukprot:Rmarinus@m.28436
MSSFGSGSPPGGSENEQNAEPLDVDSDSSGGPHVRTAAPYPRSPFLMMDSGDGRPLGNPQVSGTRADTSPTFLPRPFGSEREPLHSHGNGKRPVGSPSSASLRSIAGAGEQPMSSYGSDQSRGSDTKGSDTGKSDVSTHVSVRSGVPTPTLTPAHTLYNEEDVRYLQKNQDLSDRHDTVGDSEGSENRKVDKWSIGKPTEELGAMMRRLREAQRREKQHIDELLSEGEGAMPAGTAAGPRYSSHGSNDEAGIEARGENDRAMATNSRPPLFDKDSFVAGVPPRATRGAMSKGLDLSDMSVIVPSNGAGEDVSWLEGKGADVFRQLGDAADAASGGITDPPLSVRSEEADAGGLGVLGYMPKPWLPGVESVVENHKGVLDRRLDEVNEELDALRGEASNIEVLAKPKVAERQRLLVDLQKEIMMVAVEAESRLRQQSEEHAREVKRLEEMRADGRREASAEHFAAVEALKGQYFANDKAGHAEYDKLLAMFRKKQEERDEHRSKWMNQLEREYDVRSRELEESRAAETARLTSLKEEITYEKISYEKELIDIDSRREIAQRAYFDVDTAIKQAEANADALEASHATELEKLAEVLKQREFDYSQQVKQLQTSLRKEWEDLVSTSDLQQRRIASVKGRLLGMHSEHKQRLDNLAKGLCMLSETVSVGRKHFESQERVVLESMRKAEQQRHENAVLRSQIALIFRERQLMQNAVTTWQYARWVVRTPFKQWRYYVQCRKTKGEYYASVSAVYERRVVKRLFLEWKFLTRALLDALADEKERLTLLSKQCLIRWCRYSALHMKQRARKNDLYQWYCRRRMGRVLKAWAAVTALYRVGELVAWRVARKVRLRAWAGWKVLYLQRVQDDALYGRADTHRRRHVLQTFLRHWLEWRRTKHVRRAQNARAYEWRVRGLVGKTFSSFGEYIVYKRRKRETNELVRCRIQEVGYLRGWKALTMYRQKKRMRRVQNEHAEEMYVDHTCAKVLKALRMYAKEKTLRRMNDAECVRRYWQLVGRRYLRVWIREYDASCVRAHQTRVAIQHWKSKLKPLAFVSWRDWVLDRHYLNSKLRTACLMCFSSLLRRYWAKWENFVVQKCESRQAQQVALSHYTLMLLLRYLKCWRAESHRRARLSFLAARVRTLRRGYLARAAWRVWHSEAEVEIERTAELSRREDCWNTSVMEEVMEKWTRVVVRAATRRSSALKEANRLRLHRAMKRWQQFCLLARIASYFQSGMLSRLTSRVLHAWRDCVKIRARLRVLKARAAIYYQQQVVRRVMQEWHGVASLAYREISRARQISKRLDFFRKGRVFDSWRNQIDRQLDRYWSPSAKKRREDGKRLRDGFPGSPASTRPLSFEKRFSFGSGVSQTSPHDSPLLRFGHDLDDQADAVRATHLYRKSVAAWRMFAHEEGTKRKNLRRATDAYQIRLLQRGLRGLHIAKSAVFSRTLASAEQQSLGSSDDLSGPDSLEGGGVINPTDRPRSYTPVPIAGGAMEAEYPPSRGRSPSFASPRLGLDHTRGLPRVPTSQTPVPPPDSVRTRGSWHAAMPAAYSHDYGGTLTRSLPIDGMEGQPGAAGSPLLGGHERGVGAGGRLPTPMRSPGVQSISGSFVPDGTEIDRKGFSTGSAVQGRGLASPHTLPRPHPHPQPQPQPHVSHASVASPRPSLSACTLFTPSMYEEANAEQPRVPPRPSPAPSPTPSQASTNASFGGADFELDHPYQLHAVHPRAPAPHSSGSRPQTSFGAPATATRHHHARPTLEGSTQANTPVPRSRPTTPQAMVTSTLSVAASPTRPRVKSHGRPFESVPRVKGPSVVQEKSSYRKRVAFRP